MAPERVSIVGAGPGDPALLTVRARDRIDAADLVLHDSLVGADVLETIPDSATIVDVGKRPDGQRTSQAAINRRMVSAARRGRQVVRLKGGDPTVFGRGGEEAEYLHAHGIPFEFVAGISSMIAAPQSAAIPVTHRDHASSLTVVTGHEDPAKPDSALDWDALARTVAAGGTLLILMGVSRLPDNVAALRANGLPADTPAAMIERATLPGEVTVTSTLGEIVEAVRTAGLSPPAVTVVGDVVRVGESIADGCVDTGTFSPDRPVLEADGGVERYRRGSDR